MVKITAEVEAPRVGLRAESAPQETVAPDEVQDVKRTTCCVVGGGPAGAVLALLLARKGVHVTLLEAHPDFDREFRGDTIHPSVMEIMDDLGLADRLLQLRHTKVRNFTLQTAAGPFTPVDFSHLNTKFPYIAMVPQTDFLEFITEEAKRYPNFQLTMSARVRELIEEDGVVRGVRYEGADGEKHEVRAILTVGADGRGSRVRRLGGFEIIKTSPPMDVLWFRLPREEDDPEGVIGRFGRGHVAVALDRRDHWQSGYVIPKGTYSELRHTGIETLRQSYAELLPELSDRVGHLEGWKQVSLLSVESSRCPKWYGPGLLLVGGRRPRDEPGRRGWDQLRYPGRRRRSERSRRTAEEKPVTAQRSGRAVPCCGAAPARAANTGHPGVSSPDPATGPGPGAWRQSAVRAAGLTPPTAPHALPAVPSRHAGRLRHLAGTR